MSARPYGLEGGYTLAAIGRFFYDLGWPVNFVILAVLVAILWVIGMRFKSLRPYLGQLLVLCAILWMSIVFFLISFSFPVPRFGGGVTEAGTIPRVWFYAIVPTIALAFFHILKGKGDPDPKWGNVRNVGIVLGTLIISISLFQFIGYYISSAAFIIVTMWLLGSRSKVELIAVPAGWVLFSHFIFARLLSVRLPIGDLWSGIFN